MAVRQIARALVKRPLNALGFDLVRLPPGPNGSNNPFALPAENQYKWLTSLGINTVLDIGAHAGEFAGKIHGILPHAAIVSFEPLPDVFARLQARMGGVPGFRAFNCALGAASARMEMQRSAHTPSSSLLPMAQLHRQAFPCTAGMTVQTIEVRRLDDVARELPLQDGILLKLDVQGYEDRVIAGGEGVVSRARLLIVETSFQTLYEGQPLFDDIYQLLKERGFRYAGDFEHLRNPADGSVLQADAIFLRR